MVKPQHVYRAIDFIFESPSHPPKPKFFVVFHCDEDSFLLLSLTTSISKLPSDLDQPDIEGCIHFDDDRGYGHSFVWNAKRVIGDNGFSFDLRTYVQLEFRSQLMQVEESLISQYATSRIEECCCLNDFEFINLLGCLLNSKFLKRKHRTSITNKIKELSDSIEK